jgi:hypothetical protein
MGSLFHAKPAAARASLSAQKEGRGEGVWTGVLGPTGSPSRTPRSRGSRWRAT